MRDLSLLVILGGLVAAALYRPWLGVIGLTVLTYLHPQSWGQTLVPDFPIYATLFSATVLSTLYAAWRRPGELQWPPADWRLIVFALLWAYFWFTTFHARAYLSAWDRFYDVSKVFLPFVLMLLLINTREKVLFVVAAIALSVGLIAIKGGYWAVMNGFADRVMGPSRSELSDNNHFAVAAIMTIPLLVLWMRQTSSRALRYLIAGSVALCVLAALSSWSRGALLSLSTTLVLLALLSRRKLLAIPILAGLMFFAFGQLPDEWFDRMATIGQYEEEESARNRLLVWERGVDYALEHPFTGAGFRGWIFTTFGAGRRDWHSSYVQVAAEHGLVGFGLWGLLLFGGVVSLFRTAWQAWTVHQDPWGRDFGSLLAVSLIGYATGGAFLSLAYWDLPYQLVLLGVLVTSLACGSSRKPGSAASAWTAIPSLLQRSAGYVVQTWAEKDRSGRATFTPSRPPSTGPE
jgi:probable O-glycosylation ligase (exosortase A-associated)